MKRKFPIFLKVLLLGIGVSILTASAALTVSYFNHKKSAESGLIDNIDNSLNEIEYLFNGSKDHSDLLNDLDIVRGYVQKIYDQDTEHKKMEDFNTWDEYLEYYENLYPWIYPNQGGTIGLSKDMLDFKNAYYHVTSILTNAMISSGCRAAYISYNDKNNNLVMLSDSRMNMPNPNDPFFHVPGSYYHVKDTDVPIDQEYGKHHGIMMSGYRTRYAHIYNIDVAEHQQDVVSTVYIEYDFTKANKESLDTFLLELFVLGMSSLTLVLIYALLSYYLFARNINKLSNASEEIRQNLVNKKVDNITEVTVKSSDEIRVLADSFNEMSREIVNYTHIIEKETLEKEKINAELAVASKIQLDALPDCTYDDDKVTIRAMIKTAKEVGGDFYDYFYLDNNRLAVIISDVSGKGIPASLFMMKGKELIKSSLNSNKTLVEAITYVNAMLSLNNKELLFITSFVGVIDFKKEEIRYVNCGHEKPYIVSSNKVTKLDGESNFVLGGESSFKFKEEAHPFKEGDYLFLFTDGLNESINNEYEEFGYQRIENLLAESKDLSLDNIINNMDYKLDEFTGKVEQFDDVTMVLVKPRKAELHLHYEKKDYEIITDIIDRFNEHFSYLKGDCKGAVGIIIDELVNNQVSYEKKEELIIDVDFTLKEKELTVTISSNGEDYNPFNAHVEKYLEEFHKDIQEGGFGLSIVKDLSKSYSYKYQKGRPTITLVVENK